MSLGKIFFFTLTVALLNILVMNTGIANFFLSEFPLQILAWQIFVFVDRSTIEFSFINVTTVGPEVA